MTALAFIGGVLFGLASLAAVIAIGLSWDKSDRDAYRAKKGSGVPVCKITSPHTHSSFDDPIDCPATKGSS